jgi:cytidine deaminase
VVFVSCYFTSNNGVSVEKINHVMEVKDIHIKIAVYQSSDELKEADAALVITAREALQFAYAPYSNFFVGAAALLANGKTLTGTNQENASYPVGICAERVLLSAIASLYPGEPIQTMAITYSGSNGESNKPISPCGMCRQAMVEYEHRTKRPFRIILSGLTGEVFVIETAKQLLPLSFTANDMNT